MSLQIKAESPYNGICDKTYLMINKIEYNNILKIAQLQISAFENVIVRKNRDKKPFFYGTIQFAKDEIIEKNIDKKGIIQLDISEIKSEIDNLLKKIYEIIKTKNNLLVNNGIIDLTKSIDC